MKTLFVVIASALFGSNLSAQTIKQIHLFPEDFIGDTIFYQDVWVYPILKERDGLYGTSFGPQKEEQYMETLDKAWSCVSKVLARKMSTDGYGGYKMLYKADVGGVMRRTSKVFGSEYLFEIFFIRIRKWDGSGYHLYTTSKDPELLELGN